MHTKQIFITATDTEVGKTEVAAALAGMWKEQHKPVQVWKPVQTGVTVGAPDADSYRLKWGSGTEQEEKDIATYTFSQPLAPWIAAQHDKREIDFSSLIEEGKNRCENSEYLIVEGAGGLAVPITEQHLMSTLIQALSLPIIIVARAGLGTVNHTLLSIEHAKTLQIPILGVILNQSTPQEEERIIENKTMIETFANVPVIGILPHMKQEKDQTLHRNKWIKALQNQPKLLEL
ncbi:dethiobiotin synthase [Longirhabdus pacifica]|uniref:dethiobiotin synthase n=1 Tax=Longirhabdus pacifica TaxID=2305227 RepID=UPI0010091194|nr:dethiobiotin synthase [Longirhabdus pacifica]